MGFKFMHYSMVKRAMDRLEEMQSVVQRRPLSGAFRRGFAKVMLEMLISPFMTT